MVKRMKKVLAEILLVCMMISSVFPAYAVEASEIPEQTEVVEVTPEAVPEAEEVPAESVEVAGADGDLVCADIIEAAEAVEAEETDEVSGDAAESIGTEKTAKEKLLGTSQHNEHDEITDWKEWTSGSSLPVATGSYYLKQDVTLDSTWNVPTGGITNLCLNGFVIGLADGKIGSVITVGSGATLNLYDCDTTREHKFGDTDGLWTWNDNLTSENVKHTVTGGVITGGTGDLSGSEYLGGGVYVVAGGTVVMNGGTIAGCSATKGGGVYVYSGTFTMSGGEIIRNKAEGLVEGSSNTGGYGGGVYVNGTFKMIDGNITENSAETDGGGVYVALNTGVTLEGGTVTGNRAEGDGGGVYVQKEQCFAAGTLITMEDGSRKPIETLKIGDLVRVFDHDTGTISTAKLFDLWKYPEKHSGVVTLHFSHGIDVTVVYGHSFFDREAKKYVSVSRDNVDSYVGHEFYNVDDECWETLDDYDLLDGEVDTYVITSEKHLNCVANGMLSNEDGLYTTLTNVFEYDDSLKIDAEKKADDLEKYGRFGYEELQYVSKETYDILNLQYLNVAFGKGMITKDAVLSLETYWSEVDPELLCGTTAQPCIDEAVETYFETSSGSVQNDKPKMLFAAGMTEPKDIAPGVYLGGTIKIIDNTANNLYLSESKTITLGTGEDGNGVAVPTEEMSIGVTLQSGTGVFTGDNAKDYHALFAADAGEDYKVINLANGNKLKVIKKYVVAAADSIEHGEISTTPTDGKVFEGETASITVTPDTGYQLRANTLKATYNDGSEKTLDLTQDTTDTAKYTFTMPAYDVTVTAEFEEKALTPVDVPTAATGLTYTGNELTGVAEATGYTVTNGKATKAGDYTATAALKAGYKWSDDTTAAKNIPWSIAKASVPAPLLKDSVTIDYKAETIAPKEGYELSLGSGAAFDAGKITAETAIDFTKSYYIRKAEDENHFVSAELTYTPVHPAAPSGFTAKEESVENKKDGTFSGITSAMEYQKNGGEWISGPGTLSGLSDETITVRTKATDEAFKSLNYTYTFTASTGKLTVTMGEVIEKVPYDGLVTKPADPVREGFAFGGWYTEEACITAWNFAVDTVKDNMTLYPKWIKNEEKKAVIGGNVTEDGSKVSQATVELFLGTEKIAATVTDNDGNYKFDNVKLGTYNIVVTKAGGSKTKTELVTVDRTGEFSADVKLPKGDVSSKVEHKEGDTIPEAKSDISKTVVGGLDEIAEEQTPAGSDRITIKLTVEPKKDEATPAQQKIKKEAGEGKKVEFLDLSLLKQVNGGDEEDIGDKNNKLLTIVIPFNFEGVNVTGMMILRNHGGNTSKLTETPNRDGEYFTPNRSEGTLTIRAKKFSDYAIAYSEVTTPDPSDDESDERHITAYAEPVANATAITGSWQYKEAEDTWYYIVDGTYLKNGWYYLANPYSKTVKTGWFCFDEAGKMQRGWILSKLGHWFFTHDIKDGDLGRLEKGWHKDDQDGLSYYLDLQTGRMYTGWHMIDGVMYYFTETSVKTTWKRDEKGRWVATEAIGKPLGSLDPTAKK